MKFGPKFPIVVGQVGVVLLFFAGMVIHYFVYMPVIDDSETGRILYAIEDYTWKFYPDNNEDASADSVFYAEVFSRTHPPFDGDFMIADSTGTILFSRFGDRGKLSEVVWRKYCGMARDRVRGELQGVARKIPMVYDENTDFSYYALYEPSHGRLYFYAANYEIAGRKLNMAYRTVVTLMIIIGLLVILISFRNLKKFTERVRKESFVDKDLETAAAIQKSMVPKEARHLLQVDLDARLLPAKKVGGDFYSYRARDGYLFFCIGDVSGKGIPAALFMSKAVTLFRSLAGTMDLPSQIASNMNDELCLRNEQNMFLTAVIGRLRLSDGSTLYVNAGHEPLLFWNGDSNSRPEFLQSSKNVPLGVVPSIDYQDDDAVLEKNGLMLLYTDGVSEAKGRKTGLFGRTAVLEMMDGIKNLDSRQINDYIIKTLTDFEKGGPQNDDITLLTMRNISTPKVLKIKNDVRDLRKLAEYLGDIFKECPFDSKEKTRIRSGLDEAVTNCVHYAYDVRGEGEILIRCTLDSRCLCFTVEDSGQEFNPLEYRAADDSTELKVGGLGISMFKSIFDEVIYNREEGRNVLKLIKNL